MRSVKKSASLSVVTLSWPIFIEIFLQMLIGNIDQFMMSHYSRSGSRCSQCESDYEYFHLPDYRYEYGYNDFDCSIFGGQKSD